MNNNSTMPMPDHLFNKLTEVVAGMFPHTDADSEIARLKTRIRMTGEPEAGDPSASIESNVWGWRILWPQSGFSDIILFGGRYKGGFSILSEGLKSLDDAIRICMTLGIPFKVVDIQEPDPL